MTRVFELDSFEIALALANYLIADGELEEDSRVNCEFQTKFRRVSPEEGGFVLQLRVDNIKGGK